MEILVKVALSGWNTLVEYVFAHTLTCLIPAFFIAGAIAAFVSKNAILKYFGPQANKFLAYSVASVSGAILAVCSCTVLPLFAGIHRKGAGLGPAIAFLYSGPAINILAVVYTARLLGFNLGIARAVSAIVFASVIGLIMAFTFKNEAKKNNSKNELVFAFEESRNTSDWHRLAFLILLVVILLTGTARIHELAKSIVVLVEVGIVISVSRSWFEKDEIFLWLSETWKLVKLIIPVLLIGVFFAGVIKAILPSSWVAHFVGGNSILANFVASFSGALMYFATLTEVPIIKALMELGMGKGPVLALLLAGPALSLPSILAIGRVVGLKKTTVYVILVVFFATFTGFVFGYFF